MNRADIDYLTGTPFITRLGTGVRRPRHAGVGLDAAGVVEAAGSDVTRFVSGDRVFANLTNYGHGAFAEYACTAERAWEPIPASVSFEIAATMPEASIIAYQGLRGGRTIKPGDSVLINGASGNVGPFAVQLAKALRGRGDRRLQHAEGRVRALARRRPRHRLHDGRLHA